MQALSPAFERFPWGGGVHVLLHHLSSAGDSYSDSSKPGSWGTPWTVLPAEKLFPVCLQGQSLEGNCGLCSAEQKTSFCLISFHSCFSLSLQVPPLRKFSGTGAFYFLPVTNTIPKPISLNSLSLFVSHPSSNQA